jgi:hypothetical protein
MITTAIAAMNASVGTMKMRADSTTPHMFAAVINAGGHADRGVQDVVDDQGGRRDEGRHLPEVPLGDGVRAAPVGEGLDDLPVGDHQRGEQDDDRAGDRQAVLERRHPRRDQHDEDGLRPVRDARQRVQ